MSKRFLSLIGLTFISFVFSIYLALLQNLPVTSQTSTLEQEKYGQQLYQTQQFEQAIQIWQPIIQTYKTQGDNLSQARILSNLALAYQQLGRATEAQESITNSLTLLQHETTSKDYLSVLAQTLNNQGLLQLASGKTELALETWEKAATIYQQISDQQGFLRTQINKTQALEQLGLHPRACQVIAQSLELEPLICKTAITETAETLTQQQQRLATTLTNLPTPLEPLPLKAWQTLAETLKSVGKLEDARLIFQQLLESAPNSEKALIMINLGKIAQSQGKYSEALNNYQQAEQTTQNSRIQLQSQLAQLKILATNNQPEQVLVLISAIEANLSKLPTNETKIAAQINYIASLIQIKQTHPKLALPSWVEMATVLVDAQNKAQNLGLQRLESYAVGNLGAIYLQTQQWSNAQSLTEQALLLSQTINAPEISYRWQWQLGKILQAQKQRKEAIATYQEAVKTLESIKSDLIAVNQDVQFSFSREVEPIYRELVNLLLQRDENSQVPQNNLLQARDLIESLQIAELNNFFQEACLKAVPQSIDQIDQQAAVIYPIILADQLAIILSLPQQPLHYYLTPVDAQNLETTVALFRYNLVIRSKRDFYQPAQKLHQWLIAPLEAELSKNGIKTLVFVLDGVLRNVPMSALYDGQQYLIEKYNLALTPGLQLLNPQPLQKTGVSTLAAGLTEARNGFPPLYYVQNELNAIQENVSSKILLNQNFTTQAFKDKILTSTFPIVHIATHGQFSSDFEQTFILTWDNRLDIRQLDQLLKGRTQVGESAIELLVLSACETASGDQRAALGLAGIAVRSGARSTIATLWSVNDEATSEFMDQFYRSLATQKVTKAFALRQSQLFLLQEPKFRHPFYWAPYVLLGNWL